MSIAEQLQTIAENVPKVYEAGHMKGYEQGMGDGVMDGYNIGLEEGYQKGQRAEYDRFWDGFQNNGARTSYQYAFWGVGWTEETFAPKYDIKPTSAIQMFRSTRVVDLIGCLNKNGVKLDFSETTDFTSTFEIGHMKNIPEVDTRSASALNSTFQGCSTNLETIEKVILKDDGSQTFTNTFINNTKLKNILFEGVIGQSISFQHSHLLTHDSLMSIINHLGTVTEVRTLTLGTTNLAKLTDAEKAIATEKGWTLA